MAKAAGSKPNKDQIKAIGHAVGPLLVIAGAGTGKTRVIVERVVRLINDGAEPGSVVALTFTEKAAAEMLERINDLRGGYTLDMPVMTYNAFGEQLLRRFAADMGLSKNMRLIGDTAQIVFLREHLDELELDYYTPVTRPDSMLKELSGYFSRLKQHVVMPQGYAEYAKKLPRGDSAQKLEAARHTELARAYANYITLCRSASVIDYDDQIYLTLELLKTRPNVKRRLQTEISYLLVDEFQDTNPMQSDLLDLLVNHAQNICVVGDDDQSIYGFRGATLDNLLDFKDRYPKTKEVILTANYRSTQGLLDSAYLLIKHNDPHRLEVKHGFDKRLKGLRSGNPPQALQFGAQRDELAWIANDIQSRLDNGDDPGSIAVLARRNSVVAKIHAELEARSINHAVAGISHDLYRQPIVQDMLAMIEAVVDPLDNSSLHHALTSSILNVPVSELTRFANQARWEHLRLWDVLNRAGQLSQSVTSALKHLQTWHEQATAKHVGQLCYGIFLDSGLKDRLVADSGSDPSAAQAIIDLSEFFDTLGEFGRIAARTSAASYVQNLPALMAAGENVSDDTAQLLNDRVAVMTVHKAKGLEWETVYIADLAEGSFPVRSMRSSLELPESLSRARSPADEHLREERRLMYVAMTRAKQNLTLSYAERVNSSGTLRRPSRFLEEAMPDTPPVQPAFSPADNGLAVLASGAPPQSVILPKSLFDKKTLVLSVSQIDRYLTCPFDFYYRYVLQVPEPEDALARTGSVIHDIISRINLGYKNGRALPLSEALQILAQNWPQAGWLSAIQRQRALNAARQTVGAVHRREAAAAVHPDLFEFAFRVSFPEAELVMKGRLDAVYIAPEIEIRDYKTSLGIDTQDKANRRARSSTQLALYALAWREVKGQMPDRLTLDFVAGDFIGTVHKKPQTLDSLKIKVLETARHIRDRQFPHGRDHTFCRHDT